jgi:hypothetical protein
MSSNNLELTQNYCHNKYACGIRKPWYLLFRGYGQCQKFQGYIGQLQKVDQDQKVKILVLIERYCHKKYSCKI